MVFKISNAVQWSELSIFCHLPCEKFRERLIDLMNKLALDFFISNPNELRELTNILTPISLQQIPLVFNKIVAHFLHNTENMPHCKVV